ncbi:MAG: 30S ribosomal protein S19 [Candidatus Aenigmarchaeota archaeon]|nr:30S ribosomal protein S19 [Candidatus Aenigmarchaeota archaeon]
MARIFLYKGKTTEELQKMSLEEFAKLVPSRERRSLLRGFNDTEKKFLEKLRKSEKPVKTHLREMVIIPEMLSKKVLIHNGKEWIALDIKTEMLGHRLGEFALTRKRVTHSAPGVGATKSSKFLPLK